MQTSIVISGFGGQGVMLSGQLLAYTGMDNGFHVTWIPSYGPEMRGGTANCTVIISDEPIGAPLVKKSDIAIVLNLPSFEKYEGLVKSGGLFVVNSSIVDAKIERALLVWFCHEAVPALSNAAYLKTTSSTSYERVPPGVRTSTLSPSSLPIKALAIGDLRLRSPFSMSASGSPTIW